jgi:hypothetical protein
VTVHVDDLHMAHWKFGGIGLVKHIQLELAQTGIQLLLQWWMLIVQCLGGFFIDQAQQCPIATGHCLFVAVVTADELNVIDVKVTGVTGHTRKKGKQP